MPAVSVIVVNWNRRALLAECLESLARQTFPDFEVIVVDNGSTDGSPAIVCERFPWARLVRLPENRGFAEGNNCGIRGATGRYVALLNNDAVADPGWLEALVTAMEARAEVGCCGSRILWYEEPHLLHSTGIVYFTCGAAVDRGWRQPDGAAFHRSDHAVGACAAAALYRRSVLEDVGLFDEAFSPAYLEDVDFSLRAQLRGHRCLYVPSAIVHHRVAATLGYRSPASVYLGARNHWFVIVKNLPLHCLIRHGAAIILYALVKTLFHLVTGRGIPCLLGQLAAWRKLPEMLRKRREIQSRRMISIQEFEALLTPIPLKPATFRSLLTTLCQRPASAGPTTRCREREGKPTP